MNILLNIFTLGLKYIYDRHYSFYTIIVEFRNKLPRPQKQAQKITEKDLEKNSVLRNISKTMTIIDLSTQRISLTETDIDDFYNKLNSFNYDFIIFKTYYKSFIRNLNRFNPEAKGSNFDLALLVDLLSETKSRPIRPLPVLIHHLKYRYKLSSWFYKLFD